MLDSRWDEVLPPGFRVSSLPSAMSLATAPLRPSGPWAQSLGEALEHRGHLTAARYLSRAQRTVTPGCADKAASYGVCPLSVTTGE